jgi:hypothetical protein
MNIMFSESSGTSTFDFVLSSEPDLPLQPGHELVPEALIREVLKYYMTDSLQTMRTFRAATELPVTQLQLDAGIPDGPR